MCTNISNLATGRTATPVKTSLDVNFNLNHQTPIRFYFRFNAFVTILGKKTFPFFSSHWSSNLLTGSTSPKVLSYELNENTTIVRSVDKGNFFGLITETKFVFFFQFSCRSTTRRNRNRRERMWKRTKLFEKCRETSVFLRTTNCSSDIISDGQTNDVESNL